MDEFLQTALDPPAFDARKPIQCHCADAPATSAVADESHRSIGYYVSLAEYAWSGRAFPDCMHSTSPSHSAVACQAPRGSSLIGVSARRETGWSSIVQVVKFSSVADDATL